MAPFYAGVDNVVRFFANEESPGWESCAIGVALAKEVRAPKPATARYSENAAKCINLMSEGLQLVERSHNG